MVVHIGVVVFAVGLASATAFGQRAEVQLSPGQTTTFAGKTLDLVGTRTVKTPSQSAFQAILEVNGRGRYTPAITQFGAGTQDVGTPAIDTSWKDDVYLTIDAIATSGTRLTFGVVVQPLVMWLWIGGGLLVVGSVLSAIPGTRRRPTDPVSAPFDAADDAGADPERRPKTGPDEGPEGEEDGSVDGEREPAAVPRPDALPVTVGVGE